MRIAVLALQGAFIEHEQMLARIGAETFEVRRLSDWDCRKDGLVIPGGESTTQTKLLHELGLFEPIQQAVKGGLPVFGTCAGLILLAQKVIGEDHVERLATMDMEVNRNAYGRQLGSFYTESAVKGIGDDIPMTYIRAPYVSRILSDKCSVLAEVGGHIVAAKQGRQFVTAFHPELNDDTRVHEYFMEKVVND